MGYFYELRRARTAKRCARCGGVISPGELYIFHHGFGMGTLYKHVNECYHARCHRIVAKNMLKNNSKVVVGVDGSYKPRSSRPLTAEERLALEEALEQGKACYFHDCCSGPATMPACPYFECCHGEKDEEES